MPYKIKFTEVFEKKFVKIIPRALQAQALQRINKLSENPFLGKPLKYSFIRELKIEKFRIYFVVFEDEVLILLVDVSDKKNQQGIIDTIYANREVFWKYVKNLKNGE